MTFQGILIIRFIQHVTHFNGIVISYNMFITKMTQNVVKIANAHLVKENQNLMDLSYKEVSRSKTWLVSFIKQHMLKIS